MVEGVCACVTGQLRWAWELRHDVSYEMGFEILFGSVGVHLLMLRFFYIKKIHRTS